MHVAFVAFILGVSMVMTGIVCWNAGYLRGRRAGKIYRKRRQHMKEREEDQQWGALGRSTSGIARRLIST